MRSKDRKKMERIKTYVEEYALENNGTTPTMRQIGNRFRMSHTTAYRYLVAMDEMGMIRYDRGKISTDIIDKINISPSLAPSFLGSIPAGPADEIEADVEEYVSIPSVFTGGLSGKHYILKVTGNSMVDAGIDPGDMLIIHEQADARVGDVVVALKDHERNTLKRVCEDDIGRYLWAENESWSYEERFYGRDFEVQGVALKVVKEIRKSLPQQLQP